MTPTHVVVLGWDEHRTADEREAANAAVRAALEDGESVQVLLDDESALEHDHPEALDRFRTGFSQASRDAGGTTYRGSLSACSPALDALLDLDSHHRFVTLDTLVVEGPDDPLLRYVPDHGDLTLGTAAVAERVETALAGHPAAVLPADRVEWRDGDTTVALDPPNVCVGDACFDLSRLEDATVDHEAGDLVLAWSASRGVLGRVLDSVGPARPSRLALPRDEATRERIETVVGRLRVLLSDGP
ncbi:hypothetical protein [Haloarchaeobius amylolyticus]|uniref:hypothetical protein n=1 Tax=Haloarchaeobius amylolyticus TaxID=1198296 RepID=UPI0022706920|nr:hypothetical protein [Haloarchaeobius amylolyticus]